jgi:succinate dehydrogenase/fumarate reductase flavoprotein subunit
VAGGEQGACECDVLVMGSGCAGLSATIQMSAQLASVTWGK